MEVLRKVGFYAVWVSSLITLYNFCCWFVYKVPTLLQSVPKAPGTMFSIALYEHNYHWFSSVYLISSMLCFTLELAIGASQTTRLSDYRPYQLFLATLPFIILVVSISVIALRSMRYEAMQGKCDISLSDPMRSFFPCTSHHTLP